MKIFHFILSHSIFISLCAAGLSLQTVQLLSLPLNGYLLAFIFFATLGGYNTYWMVSKVSAARHVPLPVFFRKSASTVIVILIALGGMLYSMTHLHLVMYNIVITFILLALYALPLLPVKNLFFARKMGFLKTVLLAFTWAHVTIMIPLQISILQLPSNGILLFCSRFLFMLMLCVIFDKRDAAMDKIRGMHSMATDISHSLLYFLMLFIFAIYVVISCMLSSYGITRLQSAALLIAGVVTLVLYFISLKRKDYVFYYFVVDGMMFLSSAATAIATI